MGAGESKNNNGLEQTLGSPAEIVCEDKRMASAAFTESGGAGYSLLPFLHTITGGGNILNT